jgi:2-hydroxymuconate-semialdehyde hydrolase
MDLWVRHALGFLDALGLDRVGVVGNSFGGGLALALAIRHPDRIGRLVLMGSSGLDFEITPGLDAVWGYEPSLEAMRKLVELFAYDQKIVTDDLVRSRFEASVRPGYHESYSAMVPPPRQRHVAALASPEAALAALDNEVLIVHGREDRVVPLESSIRMHRLIPRSQLHVFGRCGHWTQIEQNARFCRLVADFFGEQTA